MRRVEGVLVVQASPGSPAERAGLRGVDPQSGTIGDVIVEANGKTVRRLTDLIDEIEQTGVGRSVRLTVRRDRETRNVEVEVIDITRAS